MAIDLNDPTSALTANAQVKITDKEIEYLGLQGTTGSGTTGDYRVRSPVSHNPLASGTTW
jgi:hypothetical protein